MAILGVAAPLGPLLLPLAAPGNGRCNRLVGQQKCGWRGTCALFGGGGGGGGGDGGGKKESKFITREEEPEQFWQSAAEREGKGPMSTVLPYIAILGLSTPFIILALAFANGWVKVPVR